MPTDHTVAGKSILQWQREYPILEDVVSVKEVFWINDKYNASSIDTLSIDENDVNDAEERWQRFAPYLAKVFVETQSMNGIIESPLVPIPHMQRYLEKKYQQPLPGKLWLKCDSHLPISGSIKARGGIYEVLKHAEDLLFKHKLLTAQDDYSILDTKKFKDFFSQYSIAVGSTGNLGLSIGVMSAKIGFNVTVHMSEDAKQWKKDLLREKGVTVIEHRSDYSKAVEEGRKQAETDPDCYFIDDENSKDLFLGYAVAAIRLKDQLDAAGVIVDKDHPLFVYLPCGVGGGPGGVAFGLKLIYGEHVHCFFAEPTHSPCMLLGLLTELHDQVSVQDFGIDNKTDADGLAVGRPSRFVGKVIESLLSGIFTIEDDELYILLHALSNSENIDLEPSALAGMLGTVKLHHTRVGQEYISANALEGSLENGTHIVWATGGSLVPREIMEDYYNKGLHLSTLKDSLTE
ncbi:putative D-serine dehydratase [Brevibacillus reuszeri]|uniref:Probable D-serine dehydratase n=1 Tax=Brevibacillus reuszeri TaxID=54915 RepID=A0A0K9YPI3_9BACL|nr:D-serine ammonia-lyase [Brevibacillus reuszeri]KNB70562.1 serine ammonia-lyase [Brevibacillus reuszeri]MED1861469.1 D-serine ammonia-lyase [Brevibacillus reuszeri]GED70015.1 putative D-serine dehydratase [Brevibacillus reuszeri]